MTPGDEVGLSENAPEDVSSRPLLARRSNSFCPVEAPQANLHGRAAEAWAIQLALVDKPELLRVMSTSYHRILDASLNRASEGLRVVEDYVRFVLDDRHLTEEFKQLRHDLAAAGVALPMPERHACRDTLADVGTAVTTGVEMQRTDAQAVCAAGLERLKQSLRSLEEYSKIESPPLAGQFEAIRYRLYTLEAALGRTTDALDRLVDVRLYVLLDGRGSEQEFESLARVLIAAGVNAIQLRDKQLSDRELLARARLLRRLLQPEALPGGCATEEGASPSEDSTAAGAEPRTATAPLLIINDRPDVAAIVQADGVHVGQDDMTVKEARQIVGPRKVIGVSTHSIEQARAAVLAGANYLGVGPTFPSKTKQFNAFPGLPFVREVAAEIRLPAFAIGGISPENASQVAAAGLNRIAVSSAVADSPDPAAAAKAFRNALRIKP